MTVRCLLLVLGAVFACAATEPPPPPAVLAPYIHDGVFDPGDYGWMKGAYDDASEQDKAAYLSIFQWTSDCQKRAAIEVRRQLAEMGYPHTQIGDFGQGPAICRAIPSPMGEHKGGFAAFQQDLATVKPVIDGYLLGVHVADDVSSSTTDPLANQIEQHTIADQMLRYAVSWGIGPMAGAPELSQAGKDIVLPRLWTAIAVRDHLNTEWLKQVVAEHGWPKISEVGKHAAGAAWLLAQHADADPVFQVKVLRLMEPLAKQGEAEPQNYALLYDRVMLKLVGTQRYGTQFQCHDGRWGPQALEDAAKVEQWRKEAGLDTLAENTARIEQMYGRCENPG
jgi:hypothetical protein